jgi:hypothetical protein
MFPIRSAAAAATLAAILCGVPAAWAQDAAKDDALDNLLKQAETTKGSDTSEPATPGEVAPKDQALDNLLEKLGETKDAPAAAGKPAAPPAEEPAPAPPGPDRPRDELKGKAKDLDEHLEELTGRKKKKPPQEGDPKEGGALGEVIKKMREVEQRLGQPDTGEQTRQKQEEIVKGLDSVLQGLRMRQGQGRPTRTVKVDGPPSGNPPGQGNPGAQAGGAPKTRAERPEDKHSLANAKDEWGHLPPDLKTEMDNISHEKPLPRKQELISRYYLSVAKKSVSREE